METAELIPVSEWIYDLYRVEFWSDNPAYGGRLRQTMHFAASSVSQLESDAFEVADKIRSEWVEWNIIKEDVEHPRVIGNIHGLPMHESSRSHGERLWPNRR